MIAVIFYDGTKFQLLFSFILEGNPYILHTFFIISATKKMNDLEKDVKELEFTTAKILNSGFWQSLTLTLSHNSTGITLLLVNLP